MKLSSLNHSISQFSFLGWPAAAAFVLVALSACTSLKGSRRVGDSPLPIQTVDASGGTIAVPRSYETSDQLIIAGSRSQTLGQDIPAPAHVDVQLLAADGCVLAETRDNIQSAHPRLSRGRHDRYPFVVSFPLSEARDAARIVVRYHATVHSS